MQHGLLLDPRSRGYRFTVLLFTAIITSGSDFAYDSVGVILYVLVGGIRTDRLGTLLSFNTEALIAERMGSRAALWTATLLCGVSWWRTWSSTSSTGTPRAPSPWARRAPASR